MLHAAELVSVVGDDPQVTVVRLTSADNTARERLSLRKRGPALQDHLARSVLRASAHDQTTPSWVHRLVDRAAGLHAARAY